MISSSETKIQYVLKSVPATVYTDFPVHSDTEIAVYKGTTLAVKDTDYTITRDDFNRFATITTVTFAVGDIITIFRDTEDVPSTTLTATDFPYEDFEADLDKAIMRAQELATKFSDAVRVPFDTGGTIPKINKPTIIRFNDDGEPTFPPPEILPYKNVKNFQSITGYIAVTYAASAIITGVSDCKASLNITVLLLWDPDDGDPTREQKTLWVTLVEGGPSGNGGGYSIGPEEWTTVKAGLLKAEKSLPIDFDGPSLDGSDRPIHLVDTSTFGAHSSSGDTYTTPVLFGIRGDNTVRVGKSETGVKRWRIFRVSDGEPVHTDDVFGSIGTPTEHTVAGSPWPVNEPRAICATGTTWTWSGSDNNLYGKDSLDDEYLNFSNVVFFVKTDPDCEGLPITYDVFLSSPYFDVYDADVANSGLLDVATGGMKGFEIEDPTRIP